MKNALIVGLMIIPQNPKLASTAKMEINMTISLIFTGFDIIILLTILIISGFIPLSIIVQIQLMDYSVVNIAPLNSHLQ